MSLYVCLPFKFIFPALISTRCLLPSVDPGPAAELPNKAPPAGILVVLFQLEVTSHPTIGYVCYYEN